MRNKHQHFIRTLPVLAAVALFSCVVFPVRINAQRPVGSRQATSRSVDNGATATPSPDPGTSQQVGGMFALIPSPLVLCALLGLTLGALVFVRHRKALDDGDKNLDERSLMTTTASGGETQASSYDRRRHQSGTIQERRPVGRRSDPLANSFGDLPTPVSGRVSRIKQNPLPELYGAYRVEQEVGKLVTGQPHRTDVLASRSPDDRRAIESSLLKYINAPDADDDELRRARGALEEYGFVARQSASLLSANTAFERSTAARTLGDVRSPAALPFLLEALYDTEELVRIQAVTSLGELRLPSAIGALLDMARHHPEMPSSVISKALSHCTVDCFDGIGVPFDAELFAIGDGGEFTGEIHQLDQPERVIELPETMDEARFRDQLGGVRDLQNPARAEIVRSLGDSRCRSSVSALTEIVYNESDIAVRAAAITALGTIDHESVFVPIIIALGDDAREVRAAAARALSGLSIERADAYCRVVLESDELTRVAVADACIKSGVVRQAVERLASSDRRQAYEAFATLSVLASADRADLIVEAIGNPDEGIASAAVRVLAASGRPGALSGLRQMAVRGSIPELVRTAVLEVIYRIDQGQPV